VKTTLLALAFTVAILPCEAGIILDDSSRMDFQSVRGVGNSPLAAITVSAPTSINQIGAMVDLDSDGDLKFLIFDLDSSSLLLATGPQAFVDDGLTFKLSSAFSPFTLNPGITYGIGAIADVSGEWGTNNSSSGNPFTQGNITVSDDRNGNVSNFATPALGAEGTAMIILELGSGAASAVPEPATFGVLGAGLGVLALIARRKRA